MIYFVSRVLLCSLFRGVIKPVSTSSAMAFLSFLFVGSLCSLSIITPSSVIVNPDCFEHKTSTICL